MSNSKRFLAKHGLDNNSNTIQNVLDPVNLQDAATKNFASNASNLTSGTISASRLPTASTSLNGIIMIASEAEAIIGTNNTKAISPLLLGMTKDASNNYRGTLLELESNSTGEYNISLGYQSLNTSVSGSYGIAIGYQSQGNANNTSTAWTNSNISIGYQSLRGSDTIANNTGINNTAFGNNALQYNTSGENNTAVGNVALLYNTSGSNNLAFGMSSLYGNSIGSSNIGIGFNTLQSNNAGSNGIAIGFQSQQFANSTGVEWTNYSLSIGYRALRGSSNSSANTGNYNFAFGYLSAANNTSGSNLVGIGHMTLNANTTGSDNIALGFTSLLGNTIGSSNTAIGTNTLLSSIAGSGGTAIGFQSQQYANNSVVAWENHNTSVGYQSLMGSGNAASNTGNNNTAIGYQALYTVSSGSNNTAIGYLAGSNITTTSYSTAIGASSTVSTSNTVVLGRTSDVTVIGATGDDSSGNKLQVQGTIGCTTPNTSDNSTKVATTSFVHTLTQSGSDTFGIDTGVTNAYVVSYEPAIVVLIDGMVLSFKATNANTGASTLNVNGLGSKAIVGGAHSALQGGEIAIGSYCDVCFSTALNSFILISSSGAATQTATPTQSMHAVTKAFATNASNITSGTVGSAYMPAFSGDASSTAGSSVLTLSNSGVTAGTYKSVTVDAKGRVTGGTNPTTISGYGITDAPTVTGTGASGTWGISINGNAATASKIIAPTTTGSNTYEVIRAIMADNDYFRIMVGGTATDLGYVEIATADNGTEPIYVRQYSGAFTSIARTATLLDGSGNTSFPGIVSSTSLSISGTTNLSGAVTIGANTTITGTLSATSKSFLIKHPTKPDMMLRYGSLEGPENGVYVRGKLNGTNTIELPDYWINLVDENSISVQITAIGKGQNLYVESIENNTITIGSDTKINCFYFIQAERKDIKKLVVEESVDTDKYLKELGN